MNVGKVTILSNNFAFLQKAQMTDPESLIFYAKIYGIETCSFI
jgi:hypothetical protein